MSRPPPPPALPVAIVLRKKHVLVLGGGIEAEDKCAKLLAAAAEVTLVSTEVTARLAELARSRQITWFARSLVPSDVQNVHLVMLTEPDAELAARLVSLKVSARFWLCAIDQPMYSDVHLVSTVMRGPVQIGISTGGRAPLLARKLRAALDRALDARFAEFAEHFARLRAELRSIPKLERARRLDEELNGFAMEVRLSYPAGEGSGASGEPARRS